ncbi:bifunctional SulP family inorganic anion transporter/carbonic anhydrase [Streptomyces sp. NPDC002514]|uniref:bifunctional SulP family inorganic anion transporter/carbonic anhydrase n=1 Tax=Streptomyces sp. NPDC001270 TaxID=3364554 RepID=UPI0036CD299E
MSACVHTQPQHLHPPHSPPPGPARRFRIAGADLSASVAVFLIALPLSLGIALATGAPLQAGLVAAAVGGIVAGRLGGSPLQVSGPAAGLTVVTADLIHRYGWRTTCAITVLAGLAQLGLGCLRVARTALAVSPAVVHGMLAGIGLTIAIAQLHVVLGGTPQSAVIDNIVALPAQLAGLHPGAVSMSALTLALLLTWPRLPGRPGRLLRKIPAALVAVTGATATAALSGLVLPTVDLPSWSSHALAGLPEGPVLGLAAAVFTTTLVCSVQSLLGAVAVDKMAAARRGPKPHVGRSDLDRELLGQGSANIVSGALGGLPVAGVAVRSSANVQSGAVSRNSTMLHGVFVVVAALLMVPVLDLIPLASLAALVMAVGIQMVSLHHIRTVTRHREVLVYAVTTLGVVFLGVLEGVVFGVAVAVAVAMHRLTRTRITHEEKGGVHHVHVRGQLTFLAVPRLSRALHLVPQGAYAVVELDGSFMDHAAYESLQDWRTSHTGQGGTAELTGCRTGLRSSARTASTECHCRPWTPWRNHQCVMPSGGQGGHGGQGDRVRLRGDGNSRGRAPDEAGALDGNSNGHLASDGVGLAGIGSGQLAPDGVGQRGGSGNGHSASDGTGQRGGSGNGAAGGVGSRDGVGDGRNGFAGGDSGGGGGDSGASTAPAVAGSGSGSALDSAVSGVSIGVRPDIGTGSGGGAGPGGGADSSSGSGSAAGSEAVPGSGADRESKAGAGSGSAAGAGPGSVAGSVTGSDSVAGSATGAAGTDTGTGVGTGTGARPNRGSGFGRAAGSVSRSGSAPGSGLRPVTASGSGWVLGSALGSRSAVDPGIRTGAHTGTGAHFSNGDHTGTGADTGMGGVADAARSSGGHELARGISAFQRNTAPLVRSELARLAREGQRPSQLFLTCADSRLVTSMITSSGPGDLFVVRNVGNLVPLPGAEGGDDSVGAAIEYAVDVLKVRSITVCGHSGCGAMQALLDSAPEDGRSPLGRWLRHGQPSLLRMADGSRPHPRLAGRTPADAVEQLCLTNVVQQLEHLQAHDSVARARAAGALELHGMYFHVGEAQAYLLRGASGEEVFQHVPGTEELPSPA